MRMQYKLRHLFKRISLGSATFGVIRVNSTPNGNFI
jgi:hypothetical protein